jgi:hypothetical protein
MNNVVFIDVYNESPQYYFTSIVVASIVCLSLLLSLIIGIGMYRRHKTIQYERKLRDDMVTFFENEITKIRNSRRRSDLEQNPHRSYYPITEKKIRLNDSYFLYGHIIDAAGNRLIIDRDGNILNPISNLKVEVIDLPANGEEFNDKTDLNYGIYTFITINIGPDNPPDDPPTSPNPVSPQGPNNSPTAGSVKVSPDKGSSNKQCCCVASIYTRTEAVTSTTCPEYPIPNISITVSPQKPGNQVDIKIEEVKGGEKANGNEKSNPESPKNTDGQNKGSGK